MILFILSKDQVSFDNNHSFSNVCFLILLFQLSNKRRHPNGLLANDCINVFFNSVNFIIRLQFNGKSITQDYFMKIWFIFATGICCFIGN